MAVLTKEDIETLNKLRPNQRLGYRVEKLSLTTLRAALFSMDSIEELEKVVNNAERYEREFVELEKSKEPSQQEKPDGLYSDGTYLLADFKNKVIIYDLSEMKIVRTITDEFDVKKLQAIMQADCRINSPTLGKTISDLIIEMINK